MSTEKTANLPLDITEHVTGHTVHRANAKGDMLPGSIKQATLVERVDADNQKTIAAQLVLAHDGKGGVPVTILLDSATLTRLALDVKHIESLEIKDQVVGTATDVAEAAKSGIGKFMEISGGVVSRATQFADDIADKMEKKPDDSSAKKKSEDA